MSEQWGRSSVAMINLQTGHGFETERLSESNVMLNINVLPYLVAQPSVPKCGCIMPTPVWVTREFTKELSIELLVWLLIVKI